LACRAFHESELRALGIFTSDIFLKAYALARGAEPIYGSQMWIVKRPFVKMAECSPWNGFIDDVNAETLLRTARKYGAWMVTFTSQNMIDDKRLQPLPASPTLLTFPNFSPDQKLRGKLRKASALNGTIEPGNWRELQKPLSGLWSRLGRAIPAEFYSILENVGDGHSILARVKTETAAGLFYLTDQDKVHYMYSLATTPEYKRSEITSLLVSEFLKMAFDNGAPYVDLCGASIPSIYVFKKRFASTIAWRPRYIGTLNPLWYLVRPRAGLLYRDQSAHIPERDRWRDYLVKDLVTARTERQGTF
jgi:hypothetical protein